MLSFDLLLIGFVTVLALSGWVLWIAARRANEGYEDDLGFHFGVAPVLSLRMEASLTVVDALPVTSVAPRRRRGNSRAPFKVASASPFEQPAPRKRRPKRVDSTPPIDVSAQAVINSILGQESAP